MGIEVRQAALSDIGLLVEWRMEVLREVFSLPADYPLEGLKKESLRYYEQELKAGGHIACFAFLGAEIAGCGGACLYREMPSPDNLSGKCACLMNIYTRRQFRRQGVGEAIVRWLVQKAAGLGAGKICLEASLDGKPLYERIGFSPMQDMMRL